MELFADEGYEKRRLALNSRGRNLDAALRTPVIGRLGALAEVLKLPNVTGLDIAPRIVAGKVSPEFVIRVVVSKKVPLNRLRAEAVIPRSIGGFPTDVIESSGQSMMFPVHMDELGQFADELTRDGYDAKVDLFNGQAGLIVGPRGLNPLRLPNEVRALFLPLWEINALRNRELISRRSFQDIVDNRSQDWAFNKPYRD